MPTPVNFDPFTGEPVNNNYPNYGEPTAKEQEDEYFRRLALAYAIKSQIAAKNKRKAAPKINPLDNNLDRMSYNILSAREFLNLPKYYKYKKTSYKHVPTKAELRFLKYNKRYTQGRLRNDINRLLDDYDF